MSDSASLVKAKLTNVATAKRYHKRLVRYGLLVGNLAVVAIAAIIVLRNPDSQAIRHSVSSVTDSQAVNPLDTLSSADIAANASILAGLPETGFIINYADSVRSDLTTPISSGAEVVSKPQIMSAQIKTKADIQDYVVQTGDNLGSLATKFGVTSDSIKWSNGLGGGALKVGSKLQIPPVNGLVYTVKSGDTPESLASKYHSDKDKIIAFNDAEISGLKVGERIMIPDGRIAATVTVSATYYSGFAFGTSAIYGYNGYVPGYCTWYVANKRIQIGRPLPANLGNAGPWVRTAPRAGLTVNHTPGAGAAVVTSTSNPGHVAFVEEVYADGTVKISEMNKNWKLFEITSRVMSQAEASRYNYIH